MEFPRDALKDVDSDLISFYESVVREDFDTAEPDKKTLRKLRRKYAKKLKKGDPSSVHFESPAVRSAYVFYYCPCFTGALVSGFAKFLECSPDCSQRITLGDTFRICSLGGGPATEMVAIFRVVKDILSNSVSERRSKPLTIEAVSVDVDPAWMETAERVVRRLQRESDAVRLKFRFLEHDLVSGTMTDDLKEALRESDVVTMVKFFSAVHGRSDAAVRSRMIQDVCGTLRENGVLFLMESSGWKFLQEVTDAITSLEEMSRSYGPSKHTYRMSGASKGACLKLFAGQNGIKYCALRSINKIGAWCKKSFRDVAVST